MKLDIATKLSRTTIALHWIVALTVIGLLAVGIYMAETKTYSLYSWHKSLGFIIFFVIILRVVWRIKNGWPEPVGEQQRIYRILAKAVHWLLLIATVFMPISGFLMSSVGGFGVEVFGFEVVARNLDPENPRQFLAHNQAIASFFHAIHHWLGYILAAAIVLHILGGLKHHILDKNATLKRMFGAHV